MKTPKKPSVTVTLRMPGEMCDKMSIVAAMHDFTPAQYMRFLIGIDLERFADQSELALHLKDREEDGLPPLPDSLFCEYFEAFRPGAPESKAPDDLN